MTTSARPEHRALQRADHGPGVRPPVSDPAAAAQAIIEGLMPLYDLLLERPLSTRERRKSAPALLGRAASFVKATAAALAEHGDLFPEIAEDPAELLHLQRCALVFRDLRAHLYFFYMLANDTYLDCQSRAVDRARDVHRRAKQGNAYLYQPNDTRRLLRELLLGKAERLVPPQGRPPRGRSRAGRARPRPR